MANDTITLLVQEHEHKIHIKPSTSAEVAVINNLSVTFNPAHVCDENGCDCILRLKDKDINLNKLIHLDLSNCGLRLLPDNLSNLPLKSLNLSNNCFRVVPNCLLIGLGNLENLNLSNNRIGEFEMEPKCVLSLQTINLTANGMKYIPIWIAHVKSRNLIELDYSLNILGDTTENLFTKVYSYKLKKMILRDSYVLNNNIPFIKAIWTLKTLDLSTTGSKINTNCFTDYENLLDNPSWKNNIEVLRLSSLCMGYLPNSIMCLSSLKELYLSKNSFIWLPDFIGSLEMLEVLDVSNNSICILPNTITSLTRLRILKLEYNKLADVEILSSLPHLELLDLYENDLDCFDALSINRYKYLDLDCNCFETLPFGDAYSNKRTQYREEFNLIYRTTGSKEEQIDETVDSDPCSKNCYSDHDSDTNVTPNDCYEEECWDDEKIESHPDVTPSDDEWQGYMPMQKPKRRWRQRLSLEHLLEDLYADVD